MPEEGDFLPRKLKGRHGAIDVHKGACTRKRGAFETFRSVSDAYITYGGAHVQKRCAL